MVCYSKTIILAMSVFRYLTLGDKQMIERIYSSLLNHLNCVMTKESDSKIDWNYYCFYLMIIHAFCEMLSHIFCGKGNVPS